MPNHHRLGRRLGTRRGGASQLCGNRTMERFAVRSGITLTAEYGPDRIACELLIAPSQTLIELQTPIPPMSSKGVSDVLQEVLPVATRGKQIDSDTVKVQSVTLLKADYETYPSGDFAPCHPVFLPMESNDFFRGVCESLRYGLMSYACEQDNPRGSYAARNPEDRRQPHKAHTVSELNPEASDEQHRTHDSEAQAVPSTEVSWERVPWVANEALLTVTQEFVMADQ